MASSGVRQWWGLSQTVGTRARLFTWRHLGVARTSATGHAPSQPRPAIAEPRPAPTSRVLSLEPRGTRLEGRELREQHDKLMAV